MSLAHDYAGDLIIEIIAPNGESAVILKRLGVRNLEPERKGANFVSANPITFTSASELTIPDDLGEDDEIPSGIYGASGSNLGYPAEVVLTDLDTFFYNKSVEGTWKLRIRDFAYGPAGRLFSWKIRFEDGALE